MLNYHYFNLLYYTCDQVIGQITKELIQIVLIYYLYQISIQHK